MAGKKIMTYTGRMVNPLKLRQKDICIEDIAHALSMTCRFSGHTTEFYSVATHSVVVSKLVPNEDALWGLLHDAAEAYLVDLPSPVKESSKLGRLFRAHENISLNEIFIHYGLPGIGYMPDSVYGADRAAVEAEWEFVMGRDESDLPGGFIAKRFDIESAGLLMGRSGYGSCAERFSPRNAELEFLARFRELTGD